MELGTKQEAEFNIVSILFRVVPLHLSLYSKPLMPQAIYLTSLGPSALFLLVYIPYLANLSI